MYGGDNNDIFWQASNDDASDWLYGGNGDDKLWVGANGFGTDTFDGGAGNDILYLNDTDLNFTYAYTSATSGTVTFDDGSVLYFTGVENIMLY